MIFLTSLYNKICKFFSVFMSYCIALARHTFLTFILFFSGVQQILFSRVEIVNVEMKALPLRCDREETMEKLSYIDKLCCENPELLDYSDENIDGLDYPDEGENEI